MTLKHELVYISMLVITTFRVFVNFEMHIFVNVYVYFA